MSLDDFLLEKYQNFVVFLEQDVLPRTEHPLRERAIAELKNASLLHVKLAISARLLTYENNLDGGLQQFLREYQIDLGSIEPAVIDELKRYLQCFIECMKA